MKTGIWIGIVIGAVILSLIVGSQLFPKEVQDKVVVIGDVEKEEGSFYNKIVSPEGYMTGYSCASWMQAFGFIDGLSGWECYLKEVDPIESSCDSLGCERFTFKCTCFEK